MDGILNLPEVGLLKGENGRDQTSAEGSYARRESIPARHITG